MNKILTTLVAIMCFSFITNAQTLKQYKKAAQQALNNQDYYAALDHYDIILQVDSQSVSNKYNHAEAARNFNAYTLAEKSYEAVMKSEQVSEFPMTSYHLATVKKNIGKYEEAKTLFQQFLESSEGIDNQYTQRANAEMEYLTWAASVVDTPDPEMTIERLGDHVNTPFSEASPMEVDGELYYSSLRFENDEDPFLPSRPVSKLLTSKEGNTGEFIDNLNIEERHTANTTISKDGNRIYYTICDYNKTTKIPCEIFYSTKTGDGAWSTSSPLPQQINFDGYTATQPNLAYDDETGQEVLYFVSDRPLGKGGMDIWYSVVTDENTYSEPKNLSEINTIDDDLTPFYHTGTQTLYFSSDGRQGLGGLDVYKVEKQANNYWSDIEHMGAPLNSSYNDFYYYVNDEETKAYLASNRLGSLVLEEAKEACCNDIYEVDIEPSLLDLQALTYNAKTKYPLNGVDIKFLQMNTVISTDNHADDNEYNYEGKRNQEYVFIASKPGYLPDTVTVSTVGVKAPEVVKGELYLRPFEMNLDALTYDFKTKSKLPGATVRLELCDKDELAKKTNNSDNDFHFGVVDPETCYKLVASRPGYEDSEVRLTTEMLKGDMTITKDIYLKTLPEILLEYLPMPLYFDNDHPNPRTTNTVTSLAYDETVDSYAAKRKEFKNRYGKGMNGEGRIQRDGEIDVFFDSKLLYGASTLTKFTESLIKYIEAGNTAELMIRGFASPIAPSTYNKKLTSRRISSVRNYLKRVYGGKIASYFESGKIKVTEVPNGEELAPKGISDSYGDRQNSVFSPNASEERRVEIIDLKMETKY